MIIIIINNNTYAQSTSEQVGKKKVPRMSPNVPNIHVPRMSPNTVKIIIGCLIVHLYARYVVVLFLGRGSVGTR